MPISFLKFLRQNEAPSASPGRTFKWWVVAFVCWLLGAAIFFRVQWLSHLDLVSGPTGDGRLVLYIHEHLFQWLRGNVLLASPAFFYPQPNVLGYSSGLILDLVPYAAFRFAGLDPFLSHQFTFIVITLLGFCCFIGCLRIAFAVRYPIAIAAAILFVFGNPAYYQLVLTNNAAIDYVPAISLMALWGLRAFPRLSPSLLGGIAAAMFFFALLFATEFYPAWFTAMATIFATLYAAISQRRKIMPFVHTYPRVLAVAAAIAVIAFGIGLIPFVWIYGPVVSLHARTFDEYLQYAPLPQYVLNLSPSNFFWGALVPLVPRNFTWLFPQLPFYPNITPTVLFSTFAGAWLVWRGRLIDRSRDSSAATFVISVAFTFIAMWLLTLQIDRMSLFWFALKFVPGATAIRAGSRFELWMMPWVVAALAVVLDRMLTVYQEKSVMAGRRAALVLSTYLAFCLFEQANTIPAFTMSRHAELGALAAVPSPPGACKSFFLSVPAPVPPFNDLQPLIMLVSQKISLPTLNGYSGWNPPGWDLNFETADYQDNVRAWIGAKGLTGVCSFALPRGPWMPFQ